MELKKAEEAAKYLGLAEQTLRMWRHKRKGPAYVKVGRLICYLKSDLDDYIKINRHNPGK
jgi:excisionase family DNA binding protein